MCQGWQCQGRSQADPAGSVLGLGHWGPKQGWECSRALLQLLTLLAAPQLERSLQDSSPGRFLGVMRGGQGGTGARATPPVPGGRAWILHPWVPPPSGSDLHHSPRPRGLLWGFLFSRKPLEHKFKSVKSVINFPLSSNQLFPHFK